MIPSSIVKRPHKVVKSICRNDTKLSLIKWNKLRWLCISRDLPINGVSPKCHTANTKRWLSICRSTLNGQFAWQFNAYWSAINAQARLSTLQAVRAINRALSSSSRWSNLFWKPSASLASRYMPRPNGSWICNGNRVSQTCQPECGPRGISWRN